MNVFCESVRRAWRCASRGMVRVFKKSMTAEDLDKARRKAEAQKKSREDWLRARHAVIIETVKDITRSVVGDHVTVREEEDRLHVFYVYGFRLFYIYEGIRGLRRFDMSEVPDSLRMSGLGHTFTGKVTVSRRRLRKIVMAYVTELLRRVRLETLMSMQSMRRQIPGGPTCEGCFFARDISGCEFGSFGGDFLLDCLPGDRRRFLGPESSGENRKEGEL